jgi:hypothetical protein
MLSAKADVKYAEVFLSAGSLNEARTMAVEAVEELALPEHASELLDSEEMVDFDVTASDRIEHDDLVHLLAKGNKGPKEPGEVGVWSCRWLE